MKKRIFIIAGASLLSISLCIGALAANATNIKKWFQSDIQTDAYEFPITPTETPEKWKEFQTYQEMVDACQIPEDTLKAMTTEGLIETCLSYPLIGNMLLNNSTYVGFKKQVSEFNGLQELLTRQNLGPAICKLYSTLSLEEISKTDEKAALRIRYLEYLLSQPEVLDTINQGQKKKLLNHALEIAETKMKKHSDTFSVMPTALLIGRILQDNEEFQKFLDENKEVKMFVETGTNFTSESFSEIMEQSEYLKKIIKE